MARRRSTVRRASGRSLLPAGALAAAALAFLAIIVVAVQSGDPTRRSNAGADDAASVGGAAAIGPARAAGDVVQRVRDMWSAAGRVQALEAENARLRAWQDIALRLAERNERFEELLRMPPDAFGEGADITQAIAAQVVLDSGGPFTRTMVANAGAEHGVRVGFIALNAHGLVGRVVSVGPRSSRILMLDDYNSRVPVMGASSRVRAIMAGQASRKPDLFTPTAAPDAPRLDHAEQSLREGERIITTGDGGLFPRGLHVGHAAMGPDGRWRVALAASQAPTDFVRITPYAGLVAPETEGALPDRGPPPRTAARSAPAPAVPAPAPRRAIAAAPPPVEPPAATQTVAEAQPPPAETPAPAEAAPQ